MLWEIFMQHNLLHPVWRFVCCLGLVFVTAGVPRLEADEPLQLFLTDCQQHKFLGCNVVRVDKFSVSDDAKKTAELSLDNGKTIFNAFGDLKEPDQLEGISMAIELEKLPIEDPMKQGRKLYSVSVTKPPEEFRTRLGKNQMRLVWTPPKVNRPGSIRLLLISPENKVYQTLDLRQNGT
jgi:hypothetical protein